MSDSLPSLPDSLPTGPWPTFRLDMTLRQGISSGRSPRVGAQPQSGPGASSSNTIRTIGPDGHIIHTPQPPQPPRVPYEEPGGVKLKQPPQRTIGPR